MSANYEPYRSLQIQDGLLYQDFVVDVFWSLLKLPICVYSSKLYQQEVGESANGVEIKHDKKYARTGNLWIETAEKARPRAGDCVPSGINRGDNSWLYVIGNYDTVFVFAKQFLKLLSGSGKYASLKNGSETSEGFLLPHDDAIKYCATVLYPQAEEKIGKKLSDMNAVGNEMYNEILRHGNGQMMLFETKKQA